MILRNLHLVNFKNYSDITVEFAPGVNFITGLNGSGKTNLLDAVHYLSMTRSYFHSGDTSNIRRGENMFLIQGTFQHDDITENLYCAVRNGQKKMFRRNQEEYERLSDHIGLFPVVMIAPTDQELITEGSEMRRKFIDSIISQYDHVHLENLIRYNQALQQRNSWLKMSSASGFTDWNSVTAWDEQLIRYGVPVYDTRTDFMKNFIPVFREIFSFISGSDESADIRFESQLQEETFEALLQSSRSRDIDFQYTTSGIHKDELQFIIRDFPAKKFASQGQQKSFVVALKLAHFSFLTAKGINRPVLLLDDIFDKLDDGRVRRLMEWVSRDGFGQLIITDSHRDRIPAIFNEIGVTVKLFDVVNDGIIETETADLS